jgi:hypothetical protein
LWEQKLKKRENIKAYYSLTANAMKNLDIAKKEQSIVLSTSNEFIIDQAKLVNGELRVDLIQTRYTLSCAVLSKDNKISTIDLSVEELKNSGIPKKNYVDLKIKKYTLKHLSDKIYTKEEIKDFFNSEKLKKEEIESFLPEIKTICISNQAAYNEYKKEKAQRIETVKNKTLSEVTDFVEKFGSKELKLSLKHNFKYAVLTKAREEKFIKVEDDVISKYGFMNFDKEFVTGARKLKTPSLKLLETIDALSETEYCKKVDALKVNHEKKVVNILKVTYNIFNFDIIRYYSV